MKYLLFFLFIFLSFTGCMNETELKALSKQNNSFSDSLNVPQTKKSEFAIVIHGGAGTILKENMTSEKEIAYHSKLEEAIRIGYNILNNGGNSLDAVQKTINVLEDSHLFNAIVYCIACQYKYVKYFTSKIMLVVLGG